MRTVRRLSLCLALGCAVLASAFASTASAGLITLGSPLAPMEFTTTTHQNCTPSCTLAPVALPGHLLRSPIDGTVISWSIEGADPAPGYALRVISIAGGGFTPFATSREERVAGSGIETFETSLPIRSGQAVAINLSAEGGLRTTALGTSPGAETVLVDPAPADFSAASGSTEAIEVPLRAVVQPQPTITAISPSAGPTGGGTAVTISGENLERAGAVRFGAAEATAFAVNSETQITAFAPAGTGAVPVSVTTVSGTATAPQAFTYAAPANPPTPSPPPSAVPTATCKVPKLKGRALGSAKKRIRSAACAVGRLTEKEGATAKEGKVVGQDPRPGATVPAGTKVKVTLGPR